MTRTKSGANAVTEAALTMDPAYSGNSRLSGYAWGAAPDVPQDRTEISLGKAMLQDDSTFELVLTLTFVSDPDVNQIILRGNPADQTIVPSSFWRELSVMELPG